MKRNILQEHFIQPTQIDDLRQLWVQRTAEIEPFQLRKTPLLPVPRLGVFMVSPMKPSKECLIFY